MPAYNRNIMFQPSMSIDKLQETMPQFTNRGLAIEQVRMEECVTYYKDLSRLDLEFVSWLEKGIEIIQAERTLRLVMGIAKNPVSNRAGIPKGRDFI